MRFITEEDLRIQYRKEPFDEINLNREQDLHLVPVSF